MRNIVIGAVVVAVLAAWLLWPSGEQLLPEEAVNAVLDEMIAAAESREPKPLISRLSQGFSGRGPHGQGIDRDQARGIIFMHMQRGSWNRFFEVGREVEAQDDTHVEASLRAVLARGGAGATLADLAPHSAGAFEFELSWELEEDGEWRIVAAEYERVDVGLLLGDPGL